MYDVLIVGGGVIGCSIARELSRTTLNIAVVERNYDLSKETSGANSGCVHAGYDPEPGTLMSKFNVEGSIMFEQLSEDLDFGFIRPGAVLLAFDEEDLKTVDMLLDRARKVHVEGCYKMTPEEILAVEPHVNPDILGGMYMPNGNATPFEMTIAMMENAIENGAELFLNSEVTAIERRQDGVFVVRAGEHTLETRSIINSAGIHAGDISRMAGGEELKQIGRRGDYLLYDTKYGHMIHGTIFPCPSKKGKGVLIIPTVEGNILVGPTSIDTEDIDDKKTIQEELDDVYENALRCIPGLPRDGVIATFMGLRAVGEKHDFLIEPSKKAPGLLNMWGIASPGLTSSPPMSMYVAEMLEEMLGEPFESDTEFNPIRKGIKHFAHLSWEQREQLIAQDSRYGRIVCRCESVTEGEIVDALHRTPSVGALDAIKHRTRAGSGRCQGGFCTCRVMEIIHRELGTPIEEICKGHPGSNIVVGQLKDFGV
ncbi:FAD/NAD(P)-binding oxidoreductase [Bacteroidia bacterium]|nr:FAD/NAD(P)-binding oxidoreductase [Bacteroidia bacterium]